ncbi:zinc finger protein 618-like isoform X3 [Myxocyprinus asiaticus]|uniref:zinc finger protein 618-like isoform X3 n=1 Tax=Myxocyprinus asiaticus TaxID=70543 RepID=UPI002221D54C|nr:zinc finger protein 618-like isoform X3 [Myxocyprinus asiaticus]
MSCQEVPNPSQEPKDTAVVPTEAGTTQAVPTTSPKPISITVKTEVASPTESVASNGKASDSNMPAEICVVLGSNSRNSQTQGSYICGICGKKYKYYNCFQTHVRAHTESDGTASGEGASLGINSAFRYTCDVCGKKYKYYSCFQEHRDLHAVDGEQYPYDHVIPVEDPKEESEPYQKMGPKTGSYTCEYCGKQYKYFNPYQEHVALHAPLKGTYGLKMEGKMSSQSGQSSRVDINSQNSSETYACGACGIQFQFYNNLLEHMQSHAAIKNNWKSYGNTLFKRPDNENHIKDESPKPCQVPAATQEQMWKPPQPTQQRSHVHSYQNRLLPEKERQQVAERLLRVMCVDLGLLGVLSSKDFLKLAQTLVDTGARNGAYSIREALGDMSSLALKQLPRMYNQVKVKVTCALGSNSSLGIAVTCHSQTLGPDSCYLLTAYQVEGVRLRRYVLGLKEASLRESPEQIHHWVQIVLSEFVMSEIRTVYVTEPRLSALAFCGRTGVSLRCAGCSLTATVQAVISRRSLQARGLHELGELLATCRDIAATTSFSRESKAAEESAAPPCWDPVVEALLKVHDNFEATCEAYGRSKSTVALLQGLNKHLLGTLACLLAPLRQAAQELSVEHSPTLQHVLPVYLRLEKLFTSKAGEVGAGSKLCHYFLEALKENFKVERVHQVAMILDPQLKLRPVPAYQHEDIISRVCDMAANMRETGSGGSGGTSVDERDSDGPSVAKQGRLDCGGLERAPCGADEPQVRKELFQYLGEPLLSGTGDLLQYWSSVMDRYPRLARLALWLLAVPAVAVHGECVNICKQTLAMRRKQQVTAEEMNKLVFLKSNFA